MQDSHSSTGSSSTFELTGGGAGGDTRVNLRLKTLNNMGSSCKKKSGHRRFLISAVLPISACFWALGERDTDGYYLIR